MSIVLELCEIRCKLGQHGAVKLYLDSMRWALDIDGNGTADPLTDGLLLIRYLYGARGDALIAGVADPLGSRKTYDAIQTYIQSLMP